MTAPFVSDSFAEPLTVPFAGHVGEVGAAWTLHPILATPITDLQIAAGAHTVKPLDSGSYIYFASGLPPTTDYVVTAPMRWDGSLVFGGGIGGTFGIWVRMDPALGRGYEFRWSVSGANTGNYQVVRFDTALSPPVRLLAPNLSRQPPQDGLIHSLALRVAGAHLTATLDGATLFDVVDPNPILGIGRAGFRIAGPAAPPQGLILDASGAPFTALQVSIPTLVGIFQQLRTRLLAFVPATFSGYPTIASLVGGADGRIFYQQGPDDATYPYIIGRWQNVVRSGAYDGVRLQGEVEFQVYARPREQAPIAGQLADLIEQALLQWCDTSSGILFTRESVRSDIPVFPSPADREVCGIRLLFNVVVWPRYLTQYIVP